MTDKELQDVMRKRPHVVILGAGASIAAIPNGDKNSRKISAMDGFIEQIGLSNILSDVNLRTQSSNLEDIYSELFERADCTEVVKSLENKIIEVLSEFELPFEPTIYDLLILSLRDKDIILSFNWDDLLIQAYDRMYNLTSDLPVVLFLHGNISMGYCSKHHKFGHISNNCPICNTKYDTQSPLLFPIKNKDYHKDSNISNQWEIALGYIKDAAILTIFGYSCPKTDIEARAMIIQALDYFGESKRQLDTIEIIEHPDKSANDIYENWSEFIDLFCGHIKIRKSFYESFSAKEPRRTTEWYTLRNLQGSWAGGNYPFHNGFTTHTDLYNYIEPLLDNEESGNIEAM